MERISQISDWKFILIRKTGFFYNRFTLHSISANIFLSWKCLLFTSTAYIQVYFWLDFIMEANTMYPDQTAPLGSNLIWVHIVCNTGYLSA